MNRHKYRCAVNGQIKDVHYFYKENELIFVCTNLEKSTGHYIPESQLMQCTGLIDKNGKLIYEGDILGPLGEDDEKVIVEWNEEEAKFHLRIEWTDYEYWNGLYDEVKHCSDYFELNDFFMSDFEVIGNIWEQDNELVQTGKETV